MHKKGVSQIVAVTLLILIAIIAILIFFSSLNPEVYEVTEEVGDLFECLQINVEAVECVNNPDVPPPLPGSFPDISGDGVINVLDVIDLLLCGDDCEEGDFNGDGGNDVEDLGILLCYWGSNLEFYENNPGQCFEDSDGDNIADIADFVPNDNEQCSACNDDVLEEDCNENTNYPDTDFDECDDCTIGIFNPNADGCGDDIVRVSIERGIGTGNMDGINFIFGFADGQTKLVSKESDAQEYETGIVNIGISTELGEDFPTSVDLAPYLEKGFYCSPTRLPVTCEFPDYTAG